MDRCASSGRIVLVALLGVTWLSVAGCQGRGPELVEPPPPEVTVAKPLSREITEYSEFTGNTKAVEKVDVRARVSGYLVKIDFEDGQEVHKDQVLFEIDPEPYQAALDQAQAEVARLQAQLTKNQADLARAKRLLPTNSIAQEDYDQRVTDVAVTEASILEAKAAKREASLNREYTLVKAPIDGRASQTNITVGNLIQAGVTGGPVLTTIVSTGSVYVTFDVDERSLLRFQQLRREAGDDIRPDHIKQLQVPVGVALANEEGFPHQAILDFADNQVDPDTGTIRVRAVLDNAERRFAPGLFVRVRLPAGKPRQALLVADRAIGSDQSEKYVLVVKPDNTAEYRQVKLGSVQEGLRVIEEGIGADDWVVVDGLQRARPGAKVGPKQIAMPLPPGQTPAPPPKPPGKEETAQK
jgi:RND family efflux transporter MFP subunit